MTRYLFIAAMCFASGYITGLVDGFNSSVSVSAFNFLAGL